MSATETLNNLSRPNITNFLMNLSAFIGAGYYLSSDVLAKMGDSIVTWIPTPIKPREFVIGGALNACAVSTAEYLTGTDNVEWSYQKALVATFTLAAVALTGSRLMEATSKWTGVILTTEKVIAIAAFDGAIKAVSCGLLFFAQFLKNFVSLKIPTTVEDAHNVSFFSLSTLYDLLKKEPNGWNNLSLSVRVALNLRFEDEGYELLPFHGFTEVGRGLSLPEVTFLHSKTDKINDFTAQERAAINELFYNASLVPQNRTPSIAEMPAKLSRDLSGLDRARANSLTDEQVVWVELYYTLHPLSKPSDETAHKILCERMYNLKLKSPNPNFVLSIDLSTTPDLVNPKTADRYRFSWFYNYFEKNPLVWNGLSIDRRFQWKEAFSREDGQHKLLNPTLAEIKALTKSQVATLHEQYHNYIHGIYTSNQWDQLDIDCQVALNKKFSDHNLDCFVIFPKTRSGVKKMSLEDIHRLHIFLVNDSSCLNDLNLPVKEELIREFNKLRLQLPGDANLAKPSLVDRVNWRCVGIGATTVAVAIVASSFFVPTMFTWTQSLTTSMSSLGRNERQLDPLSRSSGLGDSHTVTRNSCEGLDCPNPNDLFGSASGNPPQVEGQDEASPLSEHDVYDTNGFYGTGGTNHVDASLNPDSIPPSDSEAPPHFAGPVLEPENNQKRSSGNVIVKLNASLT